MQLPAAVAKWLPRSPLDADRNFLRDAWHILRNVPGGRIVFSRLVGRMAPYTGSIQPELLELRTGHAAAQMRDRREVRNHLNSIHAIALVNLAEFCGNIALIYALPDDARFIISGIEIDYVKKARGTITATSDCPVPLSSARAQYDVPVILRDAQGDVVATATLHSLVGPKRAQRQPTDVN